METAIYLLKQELQWHKSNPDVFRKSSDWEEGFIEGLKHARKFLQLALGEIERNETEYKHD